VKTEYPHNTRVTYMCDEGYSLKCESAKATCVDGVWQFGSCLPVCVEGGLQNKSTQELSY